MVVEEVDGTNLVEHTFGFDPHIFESRVASAVDKALHTDLGLLEVVSSEAGFFVPQLDEDSVGNERSQGSLSEGDDTQGQPRQRHHFQKRSKLNRFVVVGSNEVANVLGDWVAFRNVQRRQDEMSGVGQNVKGGEQKEHQQGQ